ncbi:MAG: DNA repair protein RecO [Rhodobacteraceae bacterium]|jgi:DNA repair protein RecO (recombination protein O)|nr:DNA repair protein RecO [Paracoccaceae bacterium]
MEWRAEGVLLSMRRHGESAAIVEVFTEAQGRHAGVVPGGASRRIAPSLQPGTQLALHWRARLDAHVGTLAVEPLRARAAAVMADPPALAALAAACALLSFALPERAPHPGLYRATVALLDAVVVLPDWPRAYLAWELRLLQEAGFGLDLAACAVTGATEGLAYVSPRTGRAVSQAGAGAWASRLLPLPPCLSGAPPADAAELVAALRTTGHFLERHLAPSRGDRPLPAARERLVAVLAGRRPGSG